MRLPPRLLFLGLLALGVLSSACQKGTYLKLVFKGAGLTSVHHIQVQLSLPDGRVSPGTLPKKPAAGSVLKLPASAVFILDDYSGALGIDAIAFDEANAVLGSDHKDTTIAHGKSWTVELNFVPGVVALDGGLTDLGGEMDATIVDMNAADAVTGSDAALFRITDGSIADDATGCFTTTIQASDSVSLDYNSEGSKMDAGNLLWAIASQQEHFIGWSKFGLRFIPQRAFTVTKATLNLTFSQANIPVPQLQVRYSKVDGWSRSSANSSDVSADDVMTGVLMGSAVPGVNAYVLDVKGHDWAIDLKDETITLGIDNVTPVFGTAAVSRVEFAGVNKGLAVDATRPTLDLELCR